MWPLVALGAAAWYLSRPQRNPDWITVGGKHRPLRAGDGRSGDTTPYDPAKVGEARASTRTGSVGGTMRPAREIMERRSRYQSQTTDEQRRRSSDLADKEEARVLRQVTADSSKLQSAGTWKSYKAFRQDVAKRVRGDKDLVEQALDEGLESLENEARLNVRGMADLDIWVPAVQARIDQKMRGRHATEEQRKTSRVRRDVDDVIELGVRDALRLAPITGDIRGDYLPPIAQIGIWIDKLKDPRPLWTAKQVAAERTAIVRAYARAAGVRSDDMADVIRRVLADPNVRAQDAEKVSERQRFARDLKDRQQLAIEAARNKDIPNVKPPGASLRALPPNRVVP